MTRMVECSKLKKSAPGLTNPPYPGALGQKIFENISQEAWQQWLAHQTMLINEHRLSMMDPKARDFLRTEMENFLFGAGSAKPAGYVPPVDADK
jgi:Fe-S cluster biosynthesis and repair protein YggX